MVRTLVLISTALALATTAFASSAGSPRLAVGAADPLTIRGAGFRPAERVQLSVRLDERVYTRRVRAVAGRFRAVFDATPFDRCSTDLVVRATGAAGSRATLKLAQLQCPPALTPP